MLGDEWVEPPAGKKKAVLVDLLSEIVAGRGAALTAPQQAAIEAWVSTGFKSMALSPEYDEASEPQSTNATETPAFLDN